ncbi:NACHT, LRR and PYD domains-containing protein 12 isoform X1 [Silurus meridionalis]|nr:NACHT, LRR and PYD domains-containing protein 12 isoform X1 [Silurus meridionalis]
MLYTEIQGERSNYPVPSCISMKSDESLKLPLLFKNEDSSLRHRLHGCDVSNGGLAALASALRTNPSHLRELNLSQNNVGDSGVTCISSVLENPLCKLGTLRLCNCGVSVEGCAALTSALSSNLSLTELDMSNNNVGDSGVKVLSVVLENPHSSLAKLRLGKCGVTDGGCAALSSALRSNPSHLRELSLSRNHVGDPGVQCLSAVLENPRCKLEKLWLCICGVSDEGCAALTSALRLNPSHLQELNLSCNKFGVSGVKRLSALLKTPLCNLETLWQDPEPVASYTFQKTFKLNLIKKFQWLNEVIINQGNQTLLNEIYTELYITEGHSGDINKEHEVRKIEGASRRITTEETPIKYNDIFKPLSEEDEPIRAVLMKGIAGIGKTVSVQKFILDWAEGKENQDIHLIFPLPFRELNLMKNQKLSLMKLLHVFFKETKEIKMSNLEKVLFIFDGLDECRFPLDFQNTVRVCDVNESASVPELLINLIKGNLLPFALIWITSRPAAADQIPSECVHRVTEIRGFNDPQKEEYFRKRISDQILANNIITHLKALRSLYIMCHIPVFCWISATVLERMLGEAESGEIPKTLTQMYTHFLIIQTKILREKFPKKQESDEEMLLKLGKLAFQQLMKGNLIFYKEDLRVCGIDVKEAAVYSGVCTNIFREEFGLHQSKVYCFVHLSVQEHLAALYVHLMFIKKKRNVVKKLRLLTVWLKENTISHVHKSAVDKALKCQTGNLDIFLRFLLGFSLQSNHNLLHALVTQTGSCSRNIEKTVRYIKQKISEDLPAKKSINLFHCLNELGDYSLVEEIQRYLKSGTQSELSSTQWSALVFMLLTSPHELEEFDQSKYVSTDMITESLLIKLMPVIAASRKAMLCNCGVSDEDCAALTLALRSNPSHLRELDLSFNNIRDTGVKCLSAVLGNPRCKLETLRLSNCGVSDEGCAALASALKSNPSHLRELDLSSNNVEDWGKRLLSDFKNDKHYKLQELRLRKCGVSEEGCAVLSSALKSNPSHLRELDLSQNNLEDFGVKYPSTVLENPHCKLQTLRLCECNISDEGCAALANVRSNPSHLRELNLTSNNVGDPGVKCISGILGNPHCNLETLRLCMSGVSDEGCASLASALKSNPSHLRELYLSQNNVGDLGKKLLFSIRDDKLYNLQKLM